MSNEKSLPPEIWSEEDDLAHDILPTLDEPLEFRRKLRASVEGLLPAETLDSIYGPDTGTGAAGEAPTDP